MSFYELRMYCDNAAFEEPHEEIVACLEQVTAKVRGHQDSGPILDSNGQVVGRFAFVETNDDEVCAHCGGETFVAWDFCSQACHDAWLQHL